jgi:hypothetical protein
MFEPLSGSGTIVEAERTPGNPRKRGSNESKNCRTFSSFGYAESGKETKPVKSCSV